MGYVFEMMVGKWGAVVINGGLIISFGRCMVILDDLPIETMRNMADDGLLPARWGKVNKKGAPTYAIVLTTLCTNVFCFRYCLQIVPITLLIPSEQQAIFFTWLFLGLYQMKLSLSKKRMGPLFGWLISALFKFGQCYLSLSMK